VADHAGIHVTDGDEWLVAAARSLRIKGFHPDRVLETRLRRRMASG
jgi:hypothetical protein